MRKLGFKMFVLQRKVRISILAKILKRFHLSSYHKLAIKNLRFVALGRLQKYVFPQIWGRSNGFVLQGVQEQTFMFQLALEDRNMQVRFGLKVV